MPRETLGADLQYHFDGNTLVIIEIQLRLRGNERVAGRRKLEAIVNVVCTNGESAIDPSVDVKLLPALIAPSLRPPFILRVFCVPTSPRRVLLSWSSIRFSLSCGVVRTSCPTKVVSAVFIERDGINDCK